MVREIYSLRETLTKNFDVNSTNVTESNERTNTRTNERTNEHTNGRTDKRQGENYIPRGINAGGIMKQKYRSKLYTGYAAEMILSIMYVCAKSHDCNPYKEVSGA